MPPFGRTPSSRNCGLRKYTVSGVPSCRLALVEPLPRSHSPMCSSSNTIVPPRGVTCAKPLGNTEPTRHTLAGKAVLMCDWRICGILAIGSSPLFGLFKLARSSALIEGRGDVAGGHPAQIPHLALVESAAAMHRAAIVPDHQIAVAPFVTIDEVAAAGVVEQI